MKWPFVNLSGLLSMDWWKEALGILGLLVGGFLALKLLSLFLRKVVLRKLSPHASMVITRIVYYSGLLLLILVVLQRLGVSPATLLGAAGIAGIAVGFAAQTSMSNLISGIFLLSERPFSVGDLIKVGEFTGFVVSVDLLSVKVRTFDNRFVRIPSERLINQELVNITYYPIRRLDIDLSVAYKEDFTRVARILREVAEKNPYCLDEPEPLIVFKAFGASGIEIFFGVWFIKTDYLKLKNSIMHEIKQRFDAEGIEIPFPHVSVYTGSVTSPFPIRVMDEAHDLSDVAAARDVPPPEDGRP
ncbi:mechanosensitive ion channel family protein [Spirochaeta thermophila]|uniref:Putative small conductance mechanosensitive ion channel n=1 Tax=Winmispira thermophila (strain ATCC 49972 / DSM 6192 / RI 19.B1) TaxID=665571 RepID=E0RPJ4_WINT6|nr:mechanosensitive ion channel family protein [Spirochaeta thermophila]ADN02776.1 putative small conductance mechanosensitive ion channel [Spirochaeta thermophila DSM 6192]